MTSVHASADPASAVSIARYLGATGLSLWALVMALRPDPGFSAPWPWMALFWVLQIGIGLVVLQSVLYRMSRVQGGWPWPLWLLVVGSGVLGSAVLTPVYWLIGEGLMQQVLGFASTIDDADDPGSPAGFGLASLMQEFGDIAGPVTAAWVLISWPRLQGLLPPLVVVPQALPAQDDSPAPGSLAGLTTPPAASIPSGDLPQGLPPEGVEQARPPWRAVLPPELGDDLIAVASELQYLRVWTTRGHALVLGTLQDVEDAEGAAGIRVHRSWWVHARHVRAIRRQGDGATCELSDGRAVPISRRRRAEVLARFGDAARYDRAAAASAAPADEPDQKVRRNPI